MAVIRLPAPTPAPSLQDVLRDIAARRRSEDEPEEAA
jgi:hypothetical protein